MTQDPKSDYAVGYSKPPLHSRFKKGSCANPKGRPRGAHGLQAVLAKLLDQPVVVTEDGKRRRVTKRELGFARLVDKFSDGDLSATKLLVELELTLGRRAPEEPAEARRLDAHDKAVIRNWIKQIRSS
jgi:hypothetical protein